MKGFFMVLYWMVMMAAPSVIFCFQPLAPRHRQATLAWRSQTSSSSSFSSLFNSNQNVNRRAIRKSSLLHQLPKDSDLKAATTTGDFASDSSESSSVVASADRPSFPIVLWKFSRPHTLIGSATAVPALLCLAHSSRTAAAAAGGGAAAVGSIWTFANLQALLYALIPALLMNIYITGLNQITDVEIDRINKPDLVMPAGLLSRRNAIWTVIVCAATSLAMGSSSVSGLPFLGTQGLNVALWGSFILGTLYSLPPIRLKRFPVLAAFCIVAVRGAIINASFFAHFKGVISGGSSSGGSVLANLLTDPMCYWSSGFFGIFGIVIALMKDVPDVKGDAQSEIRTFSVRLGQARVFTGMRRLLSGLFWAFGVAFWRSALLMTPSSSGVLLSQRICRGIAGTMSLLGGWSVRQQAQGVDPEEPSQVYKYYMHLWKLFYLSYLALPFAR